MSVEKRPFHGLRVPGPPEDLRSQVLARSKEAMEGGPRTDLWTLLWESRQARLAWALSILALALSHLLVPAGDAGPALSSSTLALTAPEERAELDAITDLPRVSLEVLPVIAATSSPGEAEADPERAAPEAASKENRS